MRILVIEDDPDIASFIIKGLQQEGFQAVHTDNGISGLDMLMTDYFDLAIIDLMLPGYDGYHIIKSIRDKKIMLPILILSARRDVDDKVKGLDLGADDYLEKPFAFSELVSRTRALLRRQENYMMDDVLKLADLELYTLKHKVIRNDIEIALQPKEYTLLEYLMRNKGRIISKTMLIEHVWDYNFDPQTNIVEARICKLREKIDNPFSTKLLHTIKGAGYVLEQRG